MRKEIFDKPRTTMKLLVPAGLYTFQVGRSVQDREKDRERVCERE